MRPLKLAVAEPSLVLRKGVVTVLERLSSQAVEIVEVEEPSLLVAQLRRHTPDLLIVNPATPGLPSPERLREEAHCPEMKCAALQMTMLDDAVLRAYDGVISIYDSAEQIGAKIAALTASDNVRDMRREPLSPREHEIVVCIVKGMTNKQIADCLRIRSSRTAATSRPNCRSTPQRVLRSMPSSTGWSNFLRSSRLMAATGDGCAGGCRREGRFRRVRPGSAGAQTVPAGVFRRALRRARRCRVRCRRARSESFSGGCRQGTGS